MFGIGLDFIVWGMVVTFTSILFLSCGVLSSFGITFKNSIIKYILLISVIISPLTISLLANQYYTATLNKSANGVTRALVCDLQKDILKLGNPKMATVRDNNVDSLKYVSLLEKLEVMSFMSDLITVDVYNAHMYDTVTLSVTKDYSVESKNKFFLDPKSVKLVNSFIKIDNTTKQMKLTGVVRKEVRSSFTVYTIADYHFVYSSQSQALEGYLGKEVTLDVIYLDREIKNNIISVCTIKDIIE